MNKKSKKIEMSGATWGPDGKLIAAGLQDKSVRGLVELHEDLGAPVVNDDNIVNENPDKRVALSDNYDGGEEQCISDREEQELKTLAQKSQKKSMIQKIMKELNS